MTGKLGVSLGPDSLASLGVMLGMLSWVLESFIHSQIFYDQQRDFVSSLISPDRHELWMRCIIVFLFVLFGFYARRVVRALLLARETVARVNMELVQIFDTAADGMRVIGPDFTVQRVNRTFMHLAGLESTEVVGKKCYEMFSGESCHTDTCPMNRIRGGEARVEFDAVKVRRDCSTVPCIVTATPFYDHKQQLVGIVEDFKDISEREKAELQLRHSHSRLRQVTSHLEMVREQERRTISREIHDELGQNLTALNMDVGWLVRNHSGKNDEVDDKLAGLENLLNQTIVVVRRIASEIRPGLLDDLGLQAAIEAEADKVQDRLGVMFDIVCLPEDMELDEQWRNTVFRIFKEALTNIIRHSGASTVTIRLIQTSDQVSMTVRDNGRGITEQERRTTRSLGLASMQERAWLLDGFFEISGEPGRGTTVSLTLPLPS